MPSLVSCAEVIGSLLCAHTFLLILLSRRKKKHISEDPMRHEQSLCCSQASGQAPALQLPGCLFSEEPGCLTVAVWCLLPPAYHALGTRTLVLDRSPLSFRLGTAATGSRAEFLAPFSLSGVRSCEEPGPHHQTRPALSPVPCTAISRICKVVEKELQLQSREDEAAVCLTKCPLQSLSWPWQNNKEKEITVLD